MIDNSRCIQAVGKQQTLFLSFSILLFRNIRVIRVIRG